MLTGIDYNLPRFCHSFSGLGECLTQHDVAEGVMPTRASKAIYTCSTSNCHELSQQSTEEECWVTSLYTCAELRPADVAHHVSRLYTVASVHIRVRMLRKVLIRCNSSSTGVPSDSLFCLPAIEATWDCQKDSASCKECTTLTCVQVTAKLSDLVSG
jgi:hypothetical protein